MNLKAVNERKLAIISGKNKKPRGSNGIDRKQIRTVAKDTFGSNRFDKYSNICPAKIAVRTISGKTISSLRNVHLVKRTDASVGAGKKFEIS